MSAKKTELSLQQQLTDLEELVAWFEQDDIDLEDALKKFDEGVELAEAIKARLEVVENKIIVLKERFDQEA